MSAARFANLNQRALVIFDLDGTLVDSAKDIYRAMNLTLSLLHRPYVTESQIRTWVGRGAGQLCQCVLQHQDGHIDQQKHQQLLQQFLSTYEKNVCVDTTLYSGVAEFLQYCQQQQKKMAVVTNKPYVATMGLLTALNLDSMFDYVIGGDSLPERKPSAMPLLHVKDHFNLTSEQVLMIGDSRNDVESAYAAGIDCVMLSYGYNHGEPLEACRPQQIIDSLIELM